MNRLKTTSRVAELLEKHRSQIEVHSEAPPRSTPSWLFENRISLSIAEFAGRTGVSPKTVERMIKRGEIHALRTGRRVLIPTSSIETWLNQKG